MKFRLVENLNTETLLEDLVAVKEKYPSISDDMFNLLISLDPTFEKEKDKLGTYGKWILDKYKAGTVTDYDLGHITDALKRFDSEKKHLKNKDIYQFKTLSDIDNYLNDEDSYRELSHRQEVRQRQKDRRDVDLSKEASHVFSGDGFDIWVPKTYAASCKLGQGSSWCTASTENDYYYNSYKEEYGGEYWILISQNNPEEKYQFHFESGQFMDQNDMWIGLYNFLRDHPHIKEFFSEAIIFGDISPESLADVYTILTEDDKKKINEKLAKQAIGSEGFTTLKIYAADLDLKDYNITDFVTGDLFSFNDFYWDGSFNDAQMYVDTISDKVKETISSWGFPSDIYEKLRDKETPEVFIKDIDEEYYVNNGDMISAFKNALRVAVEEGYRAGSETEALKDFKKALKKSVPVGVAVDETHLFVGERFIIFEIYPAFFTEGGLEAVVEEADESSLANIDIFEIVPSDYEYEIIQFIKNSLSDNFHEPHYGWFEFDKDTFNASLGEEIIDRFGYR